MVVSGRTGKLLPEQKEGVETKQELKILGVTFNVNPCNWDTQFKFMLSKALFRMYTLHICKYYAQNL